MIDNATWQLLAGSLRELHRTLLERSRREYERKWVTTLTAGDLLQLVTTDPFFDWLRSLSELMIDIDMIRDAEPALKDELVTAIRPAVEHLLSPPKPGEAPSPFAQQYWPAVQEDPHVAIAHAAVKRAITSWPVSPEANAATLLHERHRLSEKIRHTRKGGTS